MNVEITTPKLQDLLLGGAKGYVGFISTEPFSIELSEGIKPTGESKTKEDEEFDLPGCSKSLDFEGKTNNLRIDPSSASQPVRFYSA